MKFEKIEIKKDSKFSEGVLFEAIVKYIDSVGFPKNLMLKKLDLMEKAIINDSKELDNMVAKGNAAIGELITKTNILNTKCNTLLLELKRNFSTL